jgi:hypothetical protein
MVPRVRTSGRDQYDIRCSSLAGWRADRCCQSSYDRCCRGVYRADARHCFVCAVPKRARHFLYWLNRRRIPITDADTAIVRRFAEHRCCCPYYSAKQLRDPVYISRSHRRAVAMRVGSIVVVLQIRKTFQLQRLPVMSSTCPPVTMWSLRFSAVTRVIASATAEFTLPKTKST